jgi:SAM-dependent methyltransferase
MSDPAADGVAGDLPSPAALFDDFADSYTEALRDGLRVSGETPDYFAARRVEWVADCVREMGIPTRAVLDFGCGTGSAVPALRALPGVRNVVGVDVSRRLLDVAGARYAAPGVEFAHLDGYRPAASMDLAFCNGVFHHIPPADRAAALDVVYRALRPGGLFAFWENNPWNPGTRYVMSRIPFDRDAKTLTPPAASRLLRAAGFRVIRTDFLFIFPRALRWLRPLEPPLSRLPLGAQYQVLCARA